MKIAMLLARGTSSAILANAVRAWHPNAEILMVLEHPPSKRAVLRYRRRRLGTLTVMGQLLFQVGFVPFIRRKSAGRIEQLMTEYNLDVSSAGLARAIEVSSVNDISVSQRLVAFAPDVILVNGTRIIKPTILTCVNAPFINIHAGITPMYRGVHGGYWALWNTDSENFGVTIHLVDPGVDTGNPLCQIRLKPSPDDTFATYPFLQQARALEALKGLFLDIPNIKNIEVSNTDNTGSRQWFHPTALQYLRGRLRGVR